MKSYILILLGLASVTCVAQTIHKPTKKKTKKKHKKQKTKTNKNNVMTFDNRYEGTKGTPYVYESWYPGEIFVKSKKKVVVRELNYNCYDNELAYLDPATKAVRLINRYTVDFFYFLDGNDTLLFVPMEPENDGESIFALVLYNGGSMVYKRYEKEFVKANYEGGYSADRKYDEFADKSSLYFSKHGDKHFYRVRKSKKQILEAFPDAKDDISRFIKAEKLNLKSEEDVVKLLKYYDSL